MMKRLLIFMQMLIAFAAGVSAQETLTVCDGNSTTYELPFNGQNITEGAYTSQMIYAAADLADMNGKKITSITFYPKTSLSWTSSNTWSLAEVDQTAFSSSALLSPELTQVAVTKGTKNADGSWTITFDAPYVYNGGNLLVQGVMPQAQYSAGSADFYGVSKSNASVIKYMFFGDWEVERKGFLPKLTFTYEEETTPGPGGDSTPSVATFNFGTNPWGIALDYYDNGLTVKADDNATEMVISRESSTNRIRYRNMNPDPNIIYVYADHKATITAPEGKVITKIELEGTQIGYNSATINVDNATSYVLQPEANARWSKVSVTLVSASDAGGDAGGFVIPEGYAETANYTYNFDDLKTKSVNGSSGVDPSQLAQGWGYASQQAVPGGFFGYSTYTYHSGKAPYLANKSAETQLDFLVTPAVKGAVKLFVKNYSTSSSYDGKQYLKFYKVTKNEDGTFTAPAADAEPFFTKEFTLSESSWAELEIANLEDYEYIAFTGSCCYFDDFSAEYAVMPENPALQITSITTEVAQGDNIYADETGKGTWTGSIKVKNTGNVDLVTDRPNYSVTLTSQSTSSVSIPETIIPVSVNLAQGEETEIPLEVECQIVDLSKDGWTAIRATSNLIEYGLTSSSTLYYKQSPWFTLKNSAPNIKVNASSQDGGSLLENYALPFGLVSGSGTKTIVITNTGGSDAVITAIESTIPEGFSHNATLPLTIARGESAEVELTIGGAEGYKEGTVTITYGNGLTFTTKKLSATIIAEGTYVETFGTALTPEKTFVPGGWINQSGSSWTADASSFNVYMTSGNQTYKTEMLISPKITFTEGQVLTAGVGVGTTSMSGSSTDVYLQVYYSTDRQNWQLANVLAYSTSKKSATTDIYGNSIDASKVTTWDSFDGSGINYAKVFTFDGIPAGDYYIGFNSGYTQIDYIFGGKLATVEDDIVIENFTVNPGKSMVNYEVSASVSYSNMTDHAAAAHTVALYDGETLIEEKAGESLDAYGKSTVDFKFTPHTAGEMNLKVVVKNVEGDYAVETKVNTVTIAEEAMPAEAMAGTRTSSTQNYVPGNLNYYNSRAEWFWTADKMTLKPGDVITSISLPYYNVSKDLVVDKFEFYLENTDQKVFATAKFTDIKDAGLKPVVAAENYTWKKAGTSGSASNHALVTFTLDEPFVYDGQSIHAIMINEDPDKTNYSTYYFEYYSSETGSSLYAYDDDYSKYSTKTPTRYSYVPVAIFGIAAQAPVLSGIITEAGDALAGATVEAKAGDVIYTATTDADGKYSMEIKQPELEYVVTVSAAAHKDVSSEAATIAEDKTFDYNFTSAFVKINPAIKYSTFYDSEHAVKIPEGVTPYVFGLSLTANEMALVSYADYLEEYGETYENVVQAGEAVVLMGSGDVALEYTTSSLPLIEYNWLSGFDSAATTTVSAYWSYMDYTDADCYFYALSLNKDKDPDSVGFYWMKETGAPFVSAAHKAYLSIPMDAFSMFAGGDAFVKGIPFIKDATGIKNVNANRNDSQIYNIAGQRVNGNVKGIVIKNGKKFMVK